MGVDPRSGPNPSWIKPEEFEIRNGQLRASDVCDHCGASTGDVVEDFHDSGCCASCWRMFQRGLEP